MPTWKKSPGTDSIETVTPTAVLDEQVRNTDCGMFRTD
jgi:hypothetical protein